MKTRYFKFIVLIVLVGVFITFAYQYLTSSSNGKIVTISQSDLKEIVKEKKTCFVYIGRPSCPGCKGLYPQIKEIIKNSRKTIYYYNTEARASKKRQIRAYLTSLGVDSIPTIIFIQQGEIRTYYTANDIDEFKKNLGGN